MKKLLALVSTMALSTALSVAYGAGLPVEGSWGTSFNQNGFTFDITMKLENQTMTTTNVCTFQGRSAVASVTVPTQYDDRTITVSANAHQEVNQNGVNCNVTVQPDRVNYQVTGNALILSHDGSSERMVMTRR